MFLVLCEPSDMSGLWAYRTFGALGAPAHLVSSTLLARAMLWDHRLGRDPIPSRIRLADGHTIASDAVDGVLNRLVGLSPVAFAAASAADRDYAAQEFTALVRSWLHGLPCPVANRPTGRGLGGELRHDSEWALLAGQAGLPGATYTQTSADWMLPAPPTPVPSREVARAVVVGHTVFAAPSVPGLKAGCRRLAELAGCSVLGVDFALDDRGWRFVAASPVPDLTLGGEGLARALVELLAGRAWGNR